MSLSRQDIVRNLKAAEQIKDPDLQIIGLLLITQIEILLEIYDEIRKTRNAPEDAPEAHTIMDK